MLIGLVGFAGSGKGTVGDILVRKHGFVADSFAAPVKDAIAAIFGWPRYLLEGDTETSRQFREMPDSFWSQALNKTVTPRWALQMMGTEAGRQIFGSDLWVAALENRIRNSHAADHVITDVRFPNEIDMIHRKGGRVIWVRRGGYPEWYNIAREHNLGINKIDYELPVHYSEWAWIGSKIDITIENEAGMKELEHNVAALISVLTSTRL